MLMFDPVPVKQEAMDPVSVVSSPALSTSSSLFPVPVTGLRVALRLNVTHHLTGVWQTDFSQSLDQ